LWRFDFVFPALGSNPRLLLIVLLSWYYLFSNTIIILKRFLSLFFVFHSIGIF
jgi:hypothetical protein